MKPLYQLYNSITPQTMSVEPEPKFQAPAPTSKSFWLRPTALVINETEKVCCTNHGRL